MRLTPEQIEAIRSGAARVSRAMHGRKVDVLVQAPNLMHLPIHAIAHAEGIRL
jgi:hypothetical protein